MKKTIIITLAAIAAIICAGCGDNAVSSAQDQQADDFARRYSGNGRGHTLTVNRNPTNGGSVTVGSQQNPGTMTHNAGAQITVTANPNQGWTFTGWTGAPQGVTASNTNITVTMNSNLTLTANFQQQTGGIHTITFNANGGTITLTSATTGTDGRLTSLPTPTRDNHSFNGWFTAATGGTAVTTTTVFNSNTTIFAQWTQNQAQNVTRGSFTDARNNHTYNTIRIGGGREWMAENLNYAASSGVTANGVGSWCYGNNDSNCNTYGRLYTWDAARVACPSGWSLPTRQDWSDLVTAAGGNVAGTRLKASSPRWNGTDDFGFSALPGGFRYPDGSFSNLGDWGFWWSATEYNADGAYNVLMRTGYTDVFRGWGYKSDGFSVRCVRN